MITREEVNRLFDAAVSMATEMKMQAKNNMNMYSIVSNETNHLYENIKKFRDRILTGGNALLYVLTETAQNQAAYGPMIESDFQRIHKNRELPIPASNYTKALGAAMLVYQKENI